MKTKAVTLSWAAFCVLSYGKFSQTLVEENATGHERHSIHPELRYLKNIKISVKDMKLLRIQ
jgi:hypothetical protein